MNLDSLRLAHRDFDISMKYNYNLPGNWYWIGVIYLEIGQDKKGCEYLHRAQNSGDKDAAALIAEYCK